VKRLIKNIYFLAIPIIIVVCINEINRYSATDVNHVIHGIQTINPKITHPDWCSWACHESTSFCKNNHSYLLNNISQITDPIYYGAIRGLRSSGNYVFANIFFFVFLFPLITLGLFFNGLSIRRKIKTLKQPE